MDKVIHLFAGRLDGDEVIVDSFITLCCHQHALGLSADGGTVTPEAATCPGIVEPATPAP